MARKTFIGFGTVGEERTRNWVHYDIELIKRDLMNHFQTRIGERVMRATWGCRIWDWLFEPLTHDLRDRIVDEVRRVCLSDSRVQIVSVDVDEGPNSIEVSIDLNYVPFGVSETFFIQFERREDARFNSNPV